MDKPFEAYFKSLAGCWRIERKISTGEILIGKAVFEAISDTAFLLSETGELTLKDGQKIAASRDWFWALSGKSRLEITYDEERLLDYHLINLQHEDNRWIGSAKHLCSDDLYSGEYYFSENCFEIHHTIKGPNKNYSVMSIYSK